MRTIEQQRQQINVMVNTLRTSLERILSFGRDAEVDKAILLHCAMILFYQKLDALLESPKFISFFNKNLAHLQNEEKCAELFEQLIPPYKFARLSQLTAQELFFMIEFSSVVMLEAQKALDKHEEHGEYLRKTGVFLACAFTLGFAAFGMAIVILPTTAFSFFPTLLTVLSLSLVLLIGLIYGRLHDLNVRESLEMFKELQPVKHDIHVVHLKAGIEKNKSNIYSKSNFDVPYIPDLLPEVESTKNVFGKIQSLFFKLPKQLTICQNDLDVAIQQSTGNGL